MIKVENTSDLRFEVHFVKTKVGAIILKPDVDIMSVIFKMLSTGKIEFSKFL